MAEDGVFTIWSSNIASLNPGAEDPVKWCATHLMTQEDTRARDVGENLPPSRDLGCCQDFRRSLMGIT